MALAVLATHVDPSHLTGRPHHQGGIIFFSSLWRLYSRCFGWCAAVRRKTQESDKKLIDPDQGSGPVLGLAVLLGMVGMVRNQDQASSESGRCQGCCRPEMLPRAPGSSPFLDGRASRGERDAGAAAFMKRVMGLLPPQGPRGCSPVRWNSPMWPHSSRSGRRQLWYRCMP
jgi:hypothetical protein